MDDREAASVIWLVRNGFAGRASDGRIVDRRQNPEAAALGPEETTGVLRPKGGPETFVVTRNPDEFLRIRQWALDGQKGDIMVKVPGRFPVAVAVYRDPAQWTDNVPGNAILIETEEFFLAK